MTNNHPHHQRQSETSRDPGGPDWSPGLHACLALASLAAAVTLALTATPALAHVIGHRFQATIAGTGTNALSDPTDVAADNSSGASAGDLYVTDAANHRVEKFAASGEFILMFGREVNKTTVEEPLSTEAQQDVCTEQSGDTCQPGASTTVPGGFQTPTFLAVDSSSGLSSGDVYVADSGDHRVSKFSSSGELIASWGTAGQRSFSAISGIAIDSVGHLFVEAEPTIFEFVQNGTEVSSCEPPQPASPDGIAVDASEDFYEVTAAGKVEKLTNSCADLGELDGAAGATGLLIDPATNDLYVDQGGALIDHFAAGCALPDCEPLDSFGSGDLSGATGLAIAAASGTVYVADSTAGNVAVFPQRIVPNLSLEPITDATATTATLNATVDPDTADGGSEVTECRFEYVTGEQFQAHAYSGALTAPCSKTNFSSPTAVSAQLTSLAPRITYHYRLLATSSQGTAGTSPSEERTFTSPSNVFTATFGAAPSDPYPLSNPAGVAVDNSAGPSTGDLYVTDPANHRVEKFSPAGEFLLMFGKGVDKTTGADVCTASSHDICQAGASGSSPGAFQTPTAIAVDSSTGPSAGDVYVYDDGAKKVSKFEPSGNLLSAWASAGQLAVNTLTGVGVDGEGNLWTLDSHVDFVGSALRAYGSSGTLFSETWDYGDPGPSIDFTVGPYGEAFASFGYGFGTLAFNSYYMELKLNGTAGPSSAIAVAPNRRLFLAEPSSPEVIEELVPINEVAESYLRVGEPFGRGHVAGASALAINGYTGDVYMTSSAAGDVSVFEALGPAIRTEAIEDANHTSVQLAGHVDPLGRGEVTECYFEYGTSLSYGEKGTCAPSPPCAAAQDVTLPVSGLEPEVTYHYRLVAANANAVAYGADQTFVPHAVLDLRTEAASEVERTSATLNGSLDPDSLPTTYRFEYVEAAHYQPRATDPYAEGTSIPSPDAGPISDPSKVNLPQLLTGLEPQTTYDYRLAAHNEDGTTYGEAEQFETLPAVAGAKTEPPTAVEPGSAMLHGVYLGDGNDTHYYFEYGSDATYGHDTAPPPGTDNGTTSGEQTLSAEISGLSPGHTYHYRLVVANRFGLAYGEDRVIQTPSPPTIDGVSSANLTATSAELRAAINPQGYETTYRFEYGTTTAYSASAPLPEEAIGAGTADRTVAVHLEDLQPHATYHFRLIATNKWGAVAGEDQSFDFFPTSCPNEGLRQQTNSAFLPDCRAYELVSPSNAGNVVLLPEGAPAAPYAENPSRFAFSGVLGAIPGTNSPNSRGDTYVAARTPTGWVTHYVGVLGSETLGAELYGGINLFSNSSMSTFVDFATAAGPLVHNPPSAWNAEGESLGRWPQDAGSTVPNGDSSIGLFQPSPDFSHLVISSNNVEWAPGSGGLANEPGSVYDYDVASGETSLISLKPSGGNIEQEPSYDPTPPNEDPEPASYIELPNPNPELMRRGDPTQYHQAVSTDGSRILMGAPTGAPCEKGFTGCFEPAPVQLYMRVNDLATVEIAPDHAVDYVGMTADASKVYFTSEEHLTGEDLQHGGTSLFMWSEKGEQEGHPLTLVSKGNSNSGQGNSADCHATWVAECGVLPVETGTLYRKSVNDSATDNVIAEENGDIYFYSPEQLDGSKGITGEMNLYDYRDGQLQYVTTLEPFAEHNPTASTSKNAPIVRFQVSPDDSHAAFVTSDQITSYSTKDPHGICSSAVGTGSAYATPDEHCEEMYSYEPSTGKIICVSCNPDGSPPSHDVSASTEGLFMANDGRTFFSTVESLVQTDTNEVEDVYEYVEGHPRLITTGTDSADKAGGSGAASLVGGLAGVSANGVNVYFSTRDSLVPQDENGQYIKFYDARTDGGFPFEKPTPPCESADECHGSGSQSPNLPRPGTSADLGAGGNLNSTPGAKHHRHKKHRKHHGHKNHRSRVGKKRQRKPVHRSHVLASHTDGRGGA